MLTIALLSDEFRETLDQGELRAPEVPLAGRGRLEMLGPVEQLVLLEDL